jgi:hypothetical protein
MSNKQVHLPAIEVKDETEDKKMKIKQVSFLDPYSLKWINKRRGIDTGLNVAIQITPHKYNQLKEMFDGLDFDGGGEIDFDEFKNALQYVNDKTKQKNLLGDPKTIFKLMDTDGSGTVDLKEFITAMTADIGTSGSGISESAKEMSAVQSSFYEFANIHRRQNILEKISKSNDIVRCNEFGKLFQIQYLSDTRDDLSSEEQVGKAIDDLRRERKDLGKDYWHRKKVEHMRSRTAEMYLRSEGMSQSHAIKSQAICLSGSGSASSLHLPAKTKNNNMLNSSLSSSQLNKLSTDMSRFRLPKKTFLPKYETMESKAPQKLQRVRLEARDILRKSRGCILSKQAPLSIRKQIDAYEEENMFE